MPQRLAQRVFRLIQWAEAVLLSASMLAVAGLTIANVFTRTVLGFSMAAAEELSRFGIVLITFVGLSYATSKGRHIRMTAIYDLLPHRPRKALAIAIAGLTALLMLFLAWQAAQYATIVADLGSTSPVLRVPLFVIYLAAPLGLTLAGVQYILTVVRNLRSPEVYISFERTDAYEAEEQPEQPVSENAAQ